MTEVTVTIRVQVLEEMRGAILVYDDFGLRCPILVDCELIRSRRRLQGGEVEIVLPDWYAFSRGLRPKRAER